MKEIYYTYNNEAIASCIFLDILKQVVTLDIARSCLILPILLDDKIVKSLQQFSHEESISLEYITKEQPRLFTSFNKKYLSLLPVTINSLILLNKNNQIEIMQSEITSKGKYLDYETDMGDRFYKIKSVLPIFLKMVEKYSTDQLYRILKVQL